MSMQSLKEKTKASVRVAVMGEKRSQYFVKVWFVEPTAEPEEDEWSLSDAEEEDPIVEV